MIPHRIILYAIHSVMATICIEKHSITMRFFNISIGCFFSLHHSSLSNLNVDLHNSHLILFRFLIIFVIPYRSLSVSYPSPTVCTNLSCTRHSRYNGCPNHIYKCIVLYPNVGYCVGSYSRLFRFPHSFNHPTIMHGLLLVLVLLLMDNCAIYTSLRLRNFRNDLLHTLLQNFLLCLFHTYRQYTEDILRNKLAFHLILILLYSFFITPYLLL